MYTAHLLPKNSPLQYVKLNKPNMTEEHQIDRRMALLIDGDNAQASLVANILAEASKYGLVTIRRIYGDWTTPNMNSWRESLQVHAFQPIQQFRYTKGKNATDSAMIIDAMDILYETVVNAFCLVSSDSDYTRLATRIQGEGPVRYGNWTSRDTPRSFVNACEIFVYTDNISPEKAEVSTPSSDNSANQAPDPVPLLKAAHDLAASDDGWAFLGTIGDRLRQLDPGFDPRTYGQKQLSSLVRAHTKDFEVTGIENARRPHPRPYQAAKGPSG